jgi:hypothetical protein
MGDQQAFVYSAFRGQPYIVDQLDIQDEPIYDRTSFAPGGTVNQLLSAWFTNVGVNATPNKGLADTNMQQPRQLPVPEAFACFGIRLVPNENILGSDWEALLNTQVFQFWLNQKAYNTGNIRHYAAGMGTYPLVRIVVHQRLPEPQLRASSAVAAGDHQPAELLRPARRQ